MVKEVLKGCLIKLLFSCLLVSAAFAYSGGSGTQEDPYLISTAQDMNAIGSDSNDWNKHFKMIADINLAAYTGEQYKIIGNVSVNFTGTFDGNGYVIRNLNYTAATDVIYVGLFGRTNNATIKNLGVEDVNLSTGSGYTGGLVGFQLSGSIINCYCMGAVASFVSGFDNQVGGLVGHQLSGTITNCYSMGSVASSASTYWSVSYAGGLVGESYGSITNSYSMSEVTTNAGGDSFAGGLVGQHHDTIITNCYSMGSVTSSSSTGGAFAGGLVGNQDSSTITNCYSTGPVDATSTGLQSPSYAGGLTGTAEGTIRSCYSTGSVAATSTRTQSPSYAGGLAGSVYGVVTNCYSTGSVNSSSSSSTALAGGLAGAEYDSSSARIEKCYSTGAISATGSLIYKGGVLGSYGKSGTITGCFWDTNSSGTSDGVGNKDPDPAGVIGKTTAEMKTLSTFISAGWDFIWESINGTNDYWRMCVSEPDYPRLTWEYSPSDFVCPDGVDFYDLAIFADQWLLEKLSYDINGDGIVNFLDFAVFANDWQGDMNDLADFASQWLKPSAYNADIAPAPAGDGIVNFLDFAVFAENWLKAN